MLRNNGGSKHPIVSGPLLLLSGRRLPLHPSPGCHRAFYAHLCALAAFIDRSRETNGGASYFSTRGNEGAFRPCLRLVASSRTHSSRNRRRTSRQKTKTQFRKAAGALNCAPSHPRAKLPACALGLFHQWSKCMYDSHLRFNGTPDQMCSFRRPTMRVMCSQAACPTQGL
jgi:hypothetical protein